METTLKYIIRASFYKDYVALLLGDTEIIQVKTTKENFDFIEQELHHMVDSINHLPVLLNALQSLRGIEAWIGDREMKEMFQSKVYSAIDNFTKSSFGQYINQTH